MKGNLYGAIQQKISKPLSKKITTVAKDSQV